MRTCTSIVALVAISTAAFAPSSFAHLNIPSGSDGALIVGSNIEGDQLQAFFMQLQPNVIMRINEHPVNAPLNRVVSLLSASALSAVSNAALIHHAIRLPHCLCETIRTHCYSKIHEFLQKRTLQVLRSAGRSFRPATSFSSRD